MDSARNAIGYGAQSGQEPLSGQTGQGTANEPYDAGNLAGQSGAPASDPYATRTHDQTNTTGYGAGNDGADDSQYRTGDDGTKATTTETLAAGVTSGHLGGNIKYSHRVNPAASDSPADYQPLDTTSVGNTSNAADKGTDESRGPDEQVTSGNSSDHPRPINDNNHNAQDTFFANAGLSADKPAKPPKVASEVADKDPFASSSGDAASSIDTNEMSSRPPPTISDTTSGSDLNQGGSSSGTGLSQGGTSAPDKGYKTADTEPHPQSSEVLSSATPGAALESQYQSQTTGSGDENTRHDNPSTTGNLSGGGFDSQSQSQTLGSGYDNNNPTISTIHDNDPSTRGSDLNTTTATEDRSYDSSTPATRGSGLESLTTKGDHTNDSSTPAKGNAGYDNAIPTTTTTTTTAAAAADTDYPSPKTQPTESQGGLSGISHNTGSAPSAPDTGASYEAENASTGALPSHGEGGKMKLGDKIKEKLHMGKK
ncbi:MAG: hypothetical protein Q9224_000645 [Gallowayella concinna]